MSVICLPNYGSNVILIICQCQVFNIKFLNMKTTNYHIGMAISKLADEKKLSAETISQRLSIARQSVYATYERESIRKATVEKYANAIGVSAKDIYKLAGFNEKEAISGEESNTVFAEGENYLMVQVRKLEETVEFYKNQLTEKDHTIRALSSLLMGKFRQVFFAGLAAA